MDAGGAATPKDDIIKSVGERVNRPNINPTLIKYAKSFIHIHMYT